MMRSFTYISAIVLAAAMTSCNHKELCFDHTHTQSVNVVFDWRNAPDANPASMELHMFDAQTNAATRYSFSGRDGGPIHILGGRYHGLCMNNDDTDWARFRNVSGIDTYEIYTQDAETLDAYSLETRSVPRAEGTENERMVYTPGMVWCDHLYDIDIPLDGSNKTVTLYPEEIVSHYTVDIDNIENFENIDGSSVDGTLSGMSESFREAAKEASDTKVTMPFRLDVDENNTLHAEFLTFGESPVTKNPHILTVYVILSDGSKWYYTFDVSDQIYNAPDPRHVHIVIHGLKLPKPMSASGGLKPDVNDWNTDYVDIEM